MASPAPGCGTHTAVVIDNRTGTRVLQVDKPQRVEWTRVLNDRSSAEVEVRGGSCCDELNRIWPWRHDLLLYRGGQVVWQGPITQPVAAGSTTIHADDRWAWLDVRAIRQDLTLTGDMTEIALAIITEALQHPDGAPDETGILTNPAPHIRVTGISGTREYERFRSTAGSALRRLVGGALNVTWLGTLLMMFSNEPIARTAMLQDEDFLDPLSVTRDGYAAASATAVVGDGATAYYGQTDPYFGLIEQIIQDRAITDDGSALDLARVQTSGAMPPPVYVSVGQESTLSERAPVTVEKLVPGTEVPLWTSATCFTTNEDLILQRLRVTEDGTNGETVSVVLGRKTPIGGADIVGISVS